MVPTHAQFQNRRALTRFAYGLFCYIVSDQNDGRCDADVYCFRFHFAGRYFLFLAIVLYDKRLFRQEFTLLDGRNESIG